MALDWNKEISLSTVTDLFGSKKKGQSGGSSGYPSKTTMNLYQSEKSTTDIRKTVVAGVLLLVLIVLFAKFGVIDQLGRVSQKEAELSREQSTLASMKAGSNDYESVKEAYDAYVARYGGGSTDAIALLDMIEQRVMPAATVSSILFSDGTLTITLDNASLDTVGSIAKDLESQPIVSKANVTTASKQSSEEQNNVSTLVLTLVGSQSEEE